MTLNAGDWAVIQQVIAPTSQILDATVARLYKSGIGGKRWDYTRKFGAATLVSENTKLSLVLIDLSTSTVSFQYEFTNPFFYFELKPYFHSFQMDEKNELGGLSFANEEEAKSFFGTLCKNVFYCNKCEASCYHGSGFDHKGIFCCSCNSDVSVPDNNRFSRSLTLPVMNPPPTVVSKNLNTVTKPGPSLPLQKSSTFNLPSTTNHSRQAVNENILGPSFAKNFALGSNPGTFTTRDSRSESEPTPSSAQPMLPSKFNRGSNSSGSPPSTSPYSTPGSSARSSIRSSVSGTALNQGTTPIVSIAPGSVPLVSILPPGMRRSQSLNNPHGIQMLPTGQQVVGPQFVMPQQNVTQSPALAPQAEEPSTLTKKEIKKLEKEQKELEKKEKERIEKERKEHKEREKKEKERLDKERKEQEKERKEQKEREKKEKERLEKERKKLKKSGQAPVAMEISGPTDFQHVSSIGFNQTTHTFEIKNIPPQWKAIFKEAGITKKQLQNSETATIIYDVCVNGKQPAAQPSESLGVERRATLSNRAPPPPPAPALPPSAPALPPQTNRPPPAPPVVQRTAPDDSYRPPTPPIPEDEQPSTPPDTSANSSTVSSPNSSRSGLLSEIHAGFQLRSTKSVNENIQQTSTKEPEGSGLAETLARAMMQRRGVLQEHQEAEDDDDDDWSD